MDELTREFLIESQEGLDRMERCLTDLEKQPDDAEFLAEIFRSVHTIKGATGFLGYKRLEKLAHAGENLLGLLRDGKLSATTPIVTALLQLLDALRFILRGIEADGTEGAGDDAELIQCLAELQGAPAVQSVRIAEVPRSHQPRKKIAGTRSVRDSASRNTNSVPDPEPQQLLKAEAPVVPPAARDPSEAAGIPGFFERARGIEAGKSCAGGCCRKHAAGRCKPAESHDESCWRTGADPEPGSAGLRRGSQPHAALSPARHGDRRSARVRDEGAHAAGFKRFLEDSSHGPRLVSIRLNRRVRLEMEGQETELDKSLLEAIKDPLVHAVRNALDHGIEPPEERIAAGKDPEGTLRLRAVQEGSHVIIEVADDGAGISVDRVRQKAIERNLISAERAGQQSEWELLQLVFLPGFSTAAAVTNVSGRGVGMDVVRTNVERIGGKVELDSRPGKGTTLRLRIPLTLAIIPALIVRSVGQSFALPQAALSELVHLSKDKAASAIEWIEDAPLYRLRGSLLPLVYLDRLLVPGTGA